MKAHAYAEYVRERLCQHHSQLPPNGNDPDVHQMTSGSPKCGVCISGILFGNKKHGVGIHTTMWMTFENITLSEKSQCDQRPYNIGFHIQNKQIRGDGKQSWWLPEAGERGRSGCDWVEGFFSEEQTCSGIKLWWLPWLCEYTLWIVSFKRANCGAYQLYLNKAAIKNSKSLLSFYPISPPAPSSSSALPLLLCSNPPPAPFPTRLCLVLNPGKCFLLWGVCSWCSLYGNFLPPDICVAGSLTSPTSLFKPDIKRLSLTTLT